VGDRDPPPVDPPALAEVSLADKYQKHAGRIYLTGVQALVRLPLMQRERDRAAGLKTAGFISGYRGSPLGTYDNALWSAKELLQANDITFEPGVNEDLAATAVWGTQQVALQEDATVDGVFGIWYGKGPGVDRTTDAFKHANAAGTSKHGGVLVVAGDDHGCQSSTTAHQSEQVLAAAMIPVINPATVQDYLDFGLFGFAMSRYTGCWVGFKAVAEAVEGSATIDLDPGRMQFVTPTDFALPPEGLSIRWPDPPLDQEKRLHGPKMQAVQAFARANRIDRVVLDAPSARLGIVTTGKAYLDVRQALTDLGIDQARAAALGIRLYKLGLTWPIERAGARAFAQGLDDILVVEEKRAFVEDQLVRLLYDDPARPRIHGKETATGEPLLPSAGELTPVQVAAAIAGLLEHQHGPLPDIAAALARVTALADVATFKPAYPARTPFFCSGCPHNTSTRVPEGSRALGGIGCHWLAVQMPRSTKTYSHMGGEGAAWIGQSRYVRGKHVFQNIGDGTYFHSGLLAIRAAAASGIDITYKILYNDAVAMTGGQPVDGGLTVPQIVAQVRAEGAKRVVIVTDQPERYGSVSLPGNVPVRHRDDLDSVQRELREVPGLTVLIYDQTCAAEKRRRRKRGKLDDPPVRVFINERVCEGCGDCSVKSNCVSVKPLPTELGIKRTIDQSACNKDYSCVKGFCPSFVSITGGTPRRNVGRASLPADVPLPSTSVTLSQPYGILITGIGGTGVLTVSALLGMAAHLEGKACTTLDFTGMAQKNGAVTSHVRIARDAADLHAVRLSAGEADLLLGCDIAVAAHPMSLARYETGVTRAVVNTHATPTAAFVFEKGYDMRPDAMREALAARVGAQCEMIDASALATRLLGDAIGTNLFVMGYAFQKGWLPVSAHAIERAIELNGTAVAASKQAFAWGRLAVHDRAAVQRAAGAVSQPVLEHTLDEWMARHVAWLTSYQDASYAERYRHTLGPVIAAARRVGADDALPIAAAKSLYRLMAYKDEYEVARLYTDGSFTDALADAFEGDMRVEVHLAPPLFAKKDPQTGVPRKRKFGPWMFTAMRTLARLRRLRGTALDPFGRTAERRMERALVTEFEAVLADIASQLRADNIAVATALAAAPQEMRGFGHVKEKNVAIGRARIAELRGRLARTRDVAVAAD
jgi:indolepyruvate ferredoxin oxidoreductase